MAISRIRCDIRGIVQGVGFRPFVYRLAIRHGLTGWVCNTSGGVIAEAEGPADGLAAFVAAIRIEAPPLAVIGSLECRDLPPAGDDRFVIRESAAGGQDIELSPDWDVCPDCLRELFDSNDRRYRYPFITCTNCGPRYSIITGTPYDRPLTTMAPFVMCPSCRAEYDDPADRRFHAQPNGCPACGPSLALRDAGGEEVAGDPVTEAVALLAGGQILAVKGTGGYHLAVDAADDEAVRELRRRKQRDEKPFALMAPGLAEIRTFARPDPFEERLVASPERPVVLVPQRDGHNLSPAVAPANGYFGVMLPSTPLHHLLLRGNFRALVMTSGNLSDEPIACHDGDARKRLGGIADLFLSHDRAIRTRLDDSVIRVFQGNPLFLRRSRGYVPRAVPLPAPQRSVLAMGAELKGALCLTRGDRAFLSQHIGDLKNPETLASLEETAAHLRRILEIEPELVAHDLHPDYLSTRWAGETFGIPKVGVQHHHAHLAACMAENGLEGEVIGVIFDGTGYGTDGTIWGGEFLVGGYDSVRRAGHLRQVPLPGGDAAVREPYRTALAWLREAFGPAAFDLPLPFVTSLTGEERKLFDRMIERRLNSPLTSSCGRLFDTAAALLGVRTRVTYEGQAAIELEGLAERGAERPAFSFLIERQPPWSPPPSTALRTGIESISAHVNRNSPVFLPPLQGEGRGGDGVTYEMPAICFQQPHPPPNLPHEGGGTKSPELVLKPHERGGTDTTSAASFILDMTPAIRELTAAVLAGEDRASLARAFHRTLAEGAAELCAALREETGLERVVLSGGVFQNKLLAEGVHDLLTARNFQVFTHRLVPPNDGGIALGQAIIAGRSRVCA